jgi:acyl carrier protein
MSRLSELVLESVADVCREKALFEGPVGFDHSLVDDLGFDSLLFVDLTVLLEERTVLEDLPLLDWADRQAMKKSERYTVRSLADAVENHAHRKRAG